MIHLPTVALLAVLANPGQPAANSQQPVLLDFYADWCGPCRMMDPIVQRLAAEGYSVRKVNIDREPQLRQQYGVTAVPTFVVLSGNREVKRIVGPTSFDQLAQLLRPATPAAPVALAVAQPTAARSGPAAAPAASTGSPQDNAMQATVRLRVEDGSGNSLGTGTIIHTHADEALVMTCGHIFRDSQGQGKIVAEVFSSGGVRTVPGTLLAYDLKHDTALIAIRPGVPVAAVQIAPPGYTIRPGDDVFSIGCDHGKDPSLRSSRITAVNKYELPDNIVVAGAPVIGRSGGGLFSSDGRLIGVCNLANKDDDEGIYAALTLLHHSLDGEQLSWIYQQPASDAPPAPNPLREPSPLLADRDAPPGMPREMPGGPQRAIPTIGTSLIRNPDLLQGGISADDEAYVVIRSRRDPLASPRVIPLNQLPADVLDQLARHLPQQPEPASVAVLPNGAATGPSRENGALDDSLRGQMR